VKKILFCGLLGSEQRQNSCFADLLNLEEKQTPLFGLRPAAGMRYKFFLQRSGTWKEAKFLFFSLWNVSSSDSLLDLREASSAHRRPVTMPPGDNAAR
jgi:hypothetical protein